MAVSTYVLTKMKKSLQGSYCNALMCEKNCRGAIVPEEDGDDKAWKCEKCGRRKGEEEVISILEEIYGGGQSDD